MDYLSKLGFVPERYYRAWEQDIREGLEKMEEMTKDIFSRGHIKTIDEMVHCYNKWEPLLSRYRGYLESKDNYCKVLDNGFHLYDPIEFLQFIEVQNAPRPEMWYSYTTVPLHSYEYMDDLHLGPRFSSHGSCSTLEELETYLGSIVEHEKNIGVPEHGRILENNCVVLVRKLSNTTPYRSDVLRVSNNFHKSRKHEETTGLQSGAQYVWDIIFPRQSDNG